MKKTLLFVAMALFAFAVLTPGLGLGSFTASAAPVAKADDPKAPPPAPPQGVSPADPSIRPPDLEHECCGRCCCGAMCRGHMEHGKGRFGRPELAPGDERMGGGTMDCRGRANRPYRSMMHQNTTRERTMDREAMCGGMAPCREMVRGEGMAPCGGMPHRGKMAPGMGMPRERMDVREHRGWGPGGIVAAERMLRHATELDLSKEQTAKLEALAFETQKALVDLHAEIEKGQLELRNQLQSGSDDLGRVKTHLETISRARTGIQEARIANLFEARKVLTEKQKKLIKDKFPQLGTILE